MKRIPLTQGKYALVDDRDFEWLNQWKWCAQKARHTFYAARYAKQGEKKVPKYILMHRLIMGFPRDLVVDHIKGNGLDNRRSQLKICTNAENIFNRQRKNKINTSGFRGVQWNKRGGKWIACVTKNKKHYWLGTFSNKIKAKLVVGIFLMKNLNL